MPDSQTSSNFLGQPPDLSGLPAAEDERYEYKSSLTSDPALGNKTARAASGFWNSGGGILVAGVDDDGRPDGGISAKVGNQSRRDWFDQQIARVTPRARYSIQSVDGPQADLNINQGSAVFLVNFAPSEVGPHMAPDNRYYIRAGAHTAPASHFIVESVRARRGSLRPILKAILRRKPGNQGVIQMGLITLTEAAALDVTLRLDPLPPYLQGAETRFPLHVPVVNAMVPFFVDFHALTFGPQKLPAVVATFDYSDMVGRQYEESTAIELERQMGPGSLGATDAQRIERELGNIAKSIGSLATAIRKNETHLSKLAQKLR